MIPVAAYVMSVCLFSNGELEEIDQMIKREPTTSNMFVRQSSEERLYLKLKLKDEVTRIKIPMCSIYGN